MDGQGKRDLALHNATGRGLGPADIALMRPMPEAATVKQTTAILGERLALQYLVSKGYRLEIANWRSGRFGEIDLIVRDDAGLLVFVEVKTRRSRKKQAGLCDQGFDAINWRKRRKIIIAAQSYLARTQRQSISCRLDVVIVLYRQVITMAGELSLDGVEIVHVPQAFDRI